MKRVLAEVTIQMGYAKLRTQAGESYLALWRNSLMSNTQLSINQLQDISTLGSLSIAYKSYL